jgi:CheY-like chemotaxis protein
MGQPQGDARQEQLGGARADFVANLGRRVAELQTALKVWRSEPTSDRAQGEMHRRVHALAAGARLLRFTRLAEELAACEKLLDEIGQRGELSASDVQTLSAMLERSPALAWGPAPEAPRPAAVAAPPVRHGASPAEPGSGPAAASRPPGSKLPVTKREGLSPFPPRVARSEWSKTPLGPVGAVLAPSATTNVAVASFPLTALVVGPAALADALTQGLVGAVTPSSEPTAFEVERTDDNTVAIDLARAVAPDVVVVDADSTGAQQLVEALLSDPLTEPVPVLVVGRWSKPDDAAAYVALGVARALAKPVSPDALRRACADVAATYVRRELRREPLGELTVDQLGARLAEELRRGLCDAADAKGRETRVAMGEGAEVLAALWGAVARIRDLVTIQAAGAVRFAPSGPEGALPLAPWLGADQPGSDGARASGPSAARIAMAASLEKLVVVVADDDPAVTWFMAGVLHAAGATVHEAHDGTRALEIAHHVTPDLVISDVLMPGLDGFALCRALKRDLVLRDVPVILLSWKEDLLQRVRELGADADGYMRKEASATAIVQRVREVLRPRQRVTERLAARGEIRGRLDGLTTRTLLALVCAHRPISTLTVRDATFLYEIEIRQGRPARATRTATDGTFQRGPRVLAALLGVGAGRFVVSPVAPAEAAALRADLEGTLAEQLLPPIASARAAQHLLSGAELVKVGRVRIDEERLGAYLAATPEPARTLLRTLAAGASPSAMITSAQASARLVEDVLCDAAAHGAVLEIADRTGGDLLTPATEAELEVLRGVRRSPPAKMIPPAFGGLPTFVETEAPGAVVEDPSPFASVVEPPLAQDDAARAPGASGPARASGWAPVASIGEDMADPYGFSEIPAPAQPVVAAVQPASVLAAPPPATDLARVPAASAPAAPPPRLMVPPPIPRIAVPAEPAPPQPAASAGRPAPGVPMTLGSLTPPPVAPQVVVESPPPKPVKAKRPVVVEETEPTPVGRRVPRPSAYAPSVRPEPARDNRMMMWVLFAVAGIAFAVAARWAREREVAPALPPVSPPAAPAEPTATAAAPAAEPESTAAPDTSSAQDLPLPAGAKVPQGQGLLEVIAGQGNTILVDGSQVGLGPLVKLPLAPRKDPYEVRIKLRGEDQVRFVVVKEGRLTRLRVAPPWSR